MKEESWALWAFVLLLLLSTATPVIGANNNNDKCAFPKTKYLLLPRPPLSHQPRRLSDRSSCPPLYPPRPSSSIPRIIFSFMFHEYITPQTEVLFEETHSLVDLYIILDSNFTFQKKPKSLAFESERKFDKYRSKVIYVVDPSPLGSGFAMEHHLRQKAIPVLEGRGIKDGLFFVLDADEIISYEALRVIKYCDVGSPLNIKLVDYWYSFDWSRGKYRTSGWHGPSAVPVEVVLKNKDDTRCYINNFRRSGGLREECFGQPTTYVQFPDICGFAGWHLSWFNGPEAVIEKAKSYAHQNLQYCLNDPENWKRVGTANATDFVTWLWRHGIWWDPVRFRNLAFPEEKIKEQIAHNWKEIWVPQRYSLNDELPRLVSENPHLYPTFFLDVDVIGEWMSRVDRDHQKQVVCEYDQKALTTSCKYDG